MKAKKVVIKKPTAKSRKGKFLDWSECRDYLQLKYGKDLRDYAGKWTAKAGEDRPYQDFWHWIVHHNDISNGSEFSIVVDEYTNEEPWVMEILAMIKAEFGNEPCFWAEW